MMDAEHYYDVNLEWIADRKGNPSAPEISQEFEVATPPEFTGGMPDIWSPEHLFVASVSSCLMTTFLAISEYSKLEYLELKVKATGKLEKVDGKFMMSKVTLNPVLTIADESKRAKAERILHKSEAACLITNSVKSEVVMNPEIIIKDEELVS